MIDLRHFGIYLWVWNNGSSSSLTVIMLFINFAQELLPLIICAIERHPDSSTRDSLTHTLFNLIKRPDENQRRIIMDVSLSPCKRLFYVKLRGPYVVW